MASVDANRHNARHHDVQTMVRINRFISWQRGTARTLGDGQRRARIGTGIVACPTLERRSKRSDHGCPNINSACGMRHVTSLCNRDMFIHIVCACSAVLQTCIVGILYSTERERDKRDMLIERWIEKYIEVDRERDREIHREIER